MRDVHTKLLSAAIDPKQLGQNSILILSILSDGQICKFSNLHIHEYQ